MGVPSAADADENETRYDPGSRIVATQRGRNGSLAGYEAGAYPSPAAHGRFSRRKNKAASGGSETIGAAS